MPLPAESACSPEVSCSEMVVISNVSAFIILICALRASLSCASEGLSSCVVFGLDELYTSPLYLFAATVLIVIGLHNILYLA